MEQQAIAVCAQPIGAVQAGDLVAYARKGERKPLLRKVVGVKRVSVFRPAVNVWEDGVSVVLAIHPQKQSPKSGSDVLTGWANSDTVDVAHYV